MKDVNIGVVLDFSDIRWSVQYLVKPSWGRHSMACKPCKLPAKVAAVED